MSTGNATVAALLEQFREQGLSQSEVAAAIGITSQNLSDLKHGRRPLTELVARRLSERFGVALEKLLDGRVTGPGRSITAGSGGYGMLPILPHPVKGNPLEHPRWDGTFVHVPAVAWRLVAQAKQPYVLRFGSPDVEGRLHRGDLVLMSQGVAPTAEIAVVLADKKCFLARRQKGTDRWVRLATGQPLAGDVTVVGHCLGILWSPLL